MCNTIKCAYIYIYVYTSYLSTVQLVRENDTIDPTAGKQKTDTSAAIMQYTKTISLSDQVPSSSSLKIYTYPTPRPTTPGSAIEIAADQGADVFTSDKLSSSYIQYKTHLKTRLFEGYFMRRPTDRIRIQIYTECLSEFGRNKNDQKLSNLHSGRTRSIRGLNQTP